jgi:DinB superfamily
MDPRYLMLIDALSGTVKDMLRLLRPVDEASAVLRPAPTDWCVKDVLAHLGYIEPLFRARLLRIVEQDNPHEHALAPDPSTHDLSRTVGQLIEKFGDERARTVVFLQGLTQAQWLRICTHETMGETKLRKQVEVLIGHDNEHLAQLVSIREFLDKQRRPVS